MKDKSGPAPGPLQPAGPKDPALVAKHPVEIMSPAGDWTCLRAALQNGADAVYFGLRGLNMRSSSQNFAVSDMKRIARDCHSAGARAYLALNTMIYENELGRVDRVLKAAAAAGIDAVICWDLAVIQRATALGLPVFLSTQMSVANSKSIQFFHHTFGIRRFVLARECTLAQIRAMRRRLGKQDVEIEVFAHGAMCVSISGRCFLSESTAGKSANRGECTQPCRREYRLVDDEGNPSFRMGDNYLLSPEDLCTLPFIEKLIEAGVTSLKIEGRARTPEYVATVTAAYRKAVDYYFANRRRRNFQAAFQSLKDSLMAELDSVFHRGLSSGFFLGQPVGQWTQADGNRASKTKRHVGEVVNFYRKAGAAEIHVRNAEFSVGDELLIQGPTTGLVRTLVESIQIDHKARQTAARGENVALQVSEPVRPRDRVFVVTSR